MLYDAALWNTGLNGQRLFPQEGPAAVVIVGTDIFDKLAIIKLLRSECPRSLILTTDLDALYLHPDFIRYTRNIIVASSSGLSPSGVQDAPSVPSVVFRDSYQTAVYHGVFRALGHSSRTPELQPHEMGVSTGISLPELKSDGGNFPIFSCWVDIRPLFGSGLKGLQKLQARCRRLFSSSLLYC